jgi:hypothetical protein
VEFVFETYCNTISTHTMLLTNRHNCFFNTLFAVCSILQIKNMPVDNYKPFQYYTKNIPKVYYTFIFLALVTFFTDTVCCGSVQYSTYIQVIVSNNLITKHKIINFFAHSVYAF